MALATIAAKGVTVGRSRVDMEVNISHTPFMRLGVCTHSSYDGDQRHAHSREAEFLLA